MSEIGYKELYDERLEAQTEAYHAIRASAQQLREGKG